MVSLRFFLSSFLSSLLSPRYSPRKSSLFILPERRDIAWLFKRDNLNLSLARLLRQTRKDLFYDVNKILGDCATALARGRRKYLSIAILLQEFSIKNFIHIYIFFTELYEIVCEWIKNCKKRKVILLHLFSFFFFSLFSKNSLLFLSFLSLYDTPLFLNYPVNESNASYIPMRLSYQPTLKTLCYRCNPIA